jgi:hypothetical protein
LGKTVQRSSLHELSRRSGNLSLCHFLKKTNSIVLLYKPDFNYLKIVFSPTMSYQLTDTKELVNKDSFNRFSG